MNTPLNPNDEPRRGRRAAAVGVAAGLLAGGAVGLFAAVPSLTSASGASTVALQDDSGDAPTSDGTTERPTGDDTVPGLPDRTTRIREALKNLVDDGTITAAQAEAVAADLASDLPSRGAGQGGPFGRMGHDMGELGGHHHGRFGGGQVIADALGIDLATLRDELRDGASLADVAAAHGVDVQVVIDAIVARASERLDQAVEDGRLTDEQAADRLAELTERVTDMVERPMPQRPGAGTDDVGTDG